MRFFFSIVDHDEVDRLRKRFMKLDKVSIIPPVVKREEEGGDSGGRGGRGVYACRRRLRPPTHTL